MARIVVATVVVVAVAGWWSFLRDRVTDVAFADLPVKAGRFGLDEEPLAAQGWPECSPSSAEFRPEIRRDRISVTIRPHEGVQCALPWAPPSWWLVGEVRVDAPTGREGHPEDPLLVMGAAGASGGASIRLRCPVEEPVTLFIELAGDPVEIGSLADPGCGSRESRAERFSFVYRYGGLETPAGWLDPKITDIGVAGEDLAFTLEMLNDTGDTITIGRCPFYDAAFVTDGGSTEYRSYLNCPGAPDDVRPGDVLRFRVALPLEGVSGTGRIELELRDENRVLNRIESDEIEVSS